MNERRNNYIKLFCVIIPFLFLFFGNCTFNAEEIDDIAGIWSNSLNTNYKEVMILYKNGKGYYKEQRNDYKSVNEIKWRLRSGGYFNVLKTSDGDYEYYFNLNKNKIYLRVIGTDQFNEWLKY